MIWEANMMGTEPNDMEFKLPAANFNFIEAFEKPKQTVYCFLSSKVSFKTFTDWLLQGQSIKSLHNVAKEGSNFALHFTVPFSESSDTWKHFNLDFMFINQMIDVMEYEFAIPTIIWTSVRWEFV